MPKHRGGAAVLHTFLPVTGLFHIGLPRDGPYSDAADDNVNVDIASSVVPIGVGADNGGMTWKVFLAELQAKGLGLFQGQSVVRSVPQVEAVEMLTWRISHMISSSRFSSGVTLKLMNCGAM